MRSKGQFQLGVLEEKPGKDLLEELIVLMVIQLELKDNKAI